MESLYFIAIVPPETICEKITQLKLEISQRFESKQALKSPPHITLHMPFRWKDKKLDALYQVIKGINDSFKSVEIELKDFDFFEPRVVFVNVVANKPLFDLQKRTVSLCRKELKLDNSNYKDQVFHPHVTIGFRDLKKRQFYAAKAHFENQKSNFKFQITEVNLLKHNGQKWKIADLSTLKQKG